MISVTERNNPFSKFEVKRGTVGRKFSHNVYFCPYITYLNQ